MMLNSRMRLYHVSRVKDPLINMLTSWLCVHIFHLDHWVKIDSVEQPIKSHSVGSGNVSYHAMAAREK